MKTFKLDAKMKTQSSALLFVLLCAAWFGLPGTAPAQPSSYTNETAVANYVKTLLYWPDAGTSNNLAAFRYKHLLYTNDAGVRADLTKMTSLYANAERTRSQTAEQELTRGLTNHPASTLLGNLLLDIYYDRAAAESIFARQTLAGADFTRFAQTSAPPAFVINTEITGYMNALESNRVALATYLRLLTNHFGLSADPNPPRGYQIFQQLAPGRGLDPASYVSNGVPVCVITNTGPLFTGYKDLVLLYDLLRDYGRTASELARLRMSRGDAADGPQVSALLTEAERFVYLHGELLRGIFPELTPTEGDPSALAEAMAGCTQSLAELGTLRQFILGKRNVLGFEPDFLMLVQKFTGAQTYYDSYDALRERLSPANPVGPLAYAKADWTQARNSYSLYRGYQDQLADQFVQLNGSAEDRLFEIVGAYPGEPDYDTPGNNDGCELWQQAQSIEVARLRIQRNQVEIDNLEAEVDIELQRAGGVTNAYITYANKRGSIAEKIGHINAAQAAANALAEAANASTWWGGGAQAVNAAVQAGAEEWKGQLEAEKERQSGLEQAEIEGIESAARVKTLLLGMNTLAVDSQEAALLLKQELGRLIALQREKENLERSLAENQTALAERYFADPSHRLRCQNDMLLANLSFDSAQKWMFFMVRALEYKWNEPFTNYDFGGRTWSSSSVFKLRNAGELEDMWYAMDDAEQYLAATVSMGTNRFDWFSVRKDFLSYKDGRTYQDPVTGQTLDAISAFRTNLLRRLVWPNPNNADCVVEFDTVRQIPGGFFFVGPIFNDDQPPTVYDAGRYLDKIQYLKIRLVGAAMSSTDPLAGKLTYGGTSYIRKPNVGQFDLVHPDRLENELTAYSTRYWYYDAPIWKFKDSLTISDVYMERSPTNNPNIPPGTAEISEFKERSVAATGWKLAIPVFSLGVKVFEVNELDDIIIYFQHRSAQRLD